MNRAQVLLIVLGVLVFGLMSSAYTVFETEQVIITQFGEPIGETRLLRRHVVLAPCGLLAVASLAAPIVDGLLSPAA